MAHLRSLNLTQEDLQYLINITSFDDPDDDSGDGHHHHTMDNGCYNCGGAVKSYSLLFRAVHGYVSLFLCVFGALANALNIAVLTRKDLAGSPINRILCGLALADLTL